MASSLSSKSVILRKGYSRIKKVIYMPNLIEVQKESFAQFLQTGVGDESKAETGLQAVFNSAFPITGFSGNASLEFVRFTLLEPKYTIEECHQKGMTYAAPIKVTVRLIIWDKQKLQMSIHHKFTLDINHPQRYSGLVIAFQGPFAII